jgi:uncharacterized membrane protein
VSNVSITCCERPTIGDKAAGLLILSQEKILRALYCYLIIVRKNVYYVNKWLLTVLFNSYMGSLNNHRMRFNLKER